MTQRTWGSVAALTLLTLIADAQGPEKQPDPQPHLKEIALERTPCFGACPVYKVTLKPDGTVTYEGKRFVEKIGKYEGQVRPLEILRLAHMAKKLGFWSMKDKYTAQITDMPSTLVTINNDGKTKTTNNYGSQGPTELWALEQLIDKVVLSVTDWKKID